MSRRGASDSLFHQLTIARGNRAEVVSSAAATAGASMAVMPSDAAAQERTTRRVLRTEINGCYPLLLLLRERDSALRCRQTSDAIAVRVIHSERLFALLLFLELCCEL